MVTLLQAFALQNRFAPLAKNLHIIFCCLATVLFIILYFKYKKLSDALWLIACDLTIILQFYGDKFTAGVIGVCEIILLAFIFIEYLKTAKAERAKKAAEKSAENASNEQDDLKDVEKAVKSERSKLASDSEDDIISNAFDDEGNAK